MMDDAVMKRKLVQQGSGALTVTVPAKWCKQHRLKAGDELDIEEEDGRLAIYAGMQPAEKSKETTLVLKSQGKRLVRSLLGGLYRRGFDKVIVRYDNEAMFKPVQEAANSLIGFEITDKKPGTCVIESFLEENEADYQNTINKIISTTRLLQQICREDYTSGKHSRMDEVEEYRQNAWKLRDFVMRITIRNATIDDRSYSQTLLVWVLEKINKFYREWYKHMQEKSYRKETVVLNYLDKVSQFYDKFVETIHKGTPDTVETLNEAYYPLLNDGYAALGKTAKQQALIAVLVIIVHNVQDVSSSLLKQ
jgi:hypothetical protein